MPNVYHYGHKNIRVHELIPAYSDVQETECCDKQRFSSGIFSRKTFFLFLPPSGTMLYAGVHVIFQLLVFIDFDDVTRIESQQRLALQETADLVTFIEEILNGKLHLL